jgi:hypothetical protein
VEAPVSRSYARKARIGFYSTTAVVGVLAAAMLATAMPLVLAVALGALVGAACGLAVAVLVRVWPVLREVWHWAAEITLLTVVVVPGALLASATQPVLGHGWAAKGWSANTISPTNPGVGLLIAEGGTPMLVKPAYLSDLDIRRIVKHAATIRAAHPPVAAVPVATAAKLAEQQARDVVGVAA